MSRDADHIPQLPTDLRFADAVRVYAGRVVRIVYAGALATALWLLAVVIVHLPAYLKIITVGVGFALGWYMYTERIARLVSVRQSEAPSVFYLYSADLNLSGRDYLLEPVALWKLFYRSILRIVLLPSLLLRLCIWMLRRAMARSTWHGAHLIKRYLSLLSAASVASSLALGVAAIFVLGFGDGNTVSILVILQLSVLVLASGAEHAARNSDNARRHVEFTHELDERRREDSTSDP